MHKRVAYDFCSTNSRVAEGDRLYSYDYHVDGQLARAERGRVEDTGFVTRESEEDFLWDGLALVRRGGRGYMNEPHAGGGNPVLADDGTAYFNDMLGTSLAAVGGGGVESFGLTAFGDELPGNAESGGTAPSPFFTGKPHVDGLGRVFLMRNYRASLGKWLTADPLGYPDGWNQLAYGINSPCDGIDLLGASWDDSDMVAYYFRYADEIAFISTASVPLATAWWMIKLLTANDYIDTDTMGLTDNIYWNMVVDAKRFVTEYVKNNIPGQNGKDSKSKFDYGVNCENVVFALGGGRACLLDTINWSWYTETKWIEGRLYERKYYQWSYSGSMKYSDSFEDPVDVLNWLNEPNIEVPGGVPYSYGHEWKSTFLSKKGFVDRLLE